VFAGCGASPVTAGKRGWSFGTQAGYIWHGRLESLAASWTVPAVRERSAGGLASTWIGASAISSAFIQVGTIEEQVGSSRMPYSNRFYAFWSDRTHAFKPVELFEVTPRTEVTASLSLSSGRWAVAIRDDEGSGARFTTTDETHNTFSSGAWLQEDPRAPVKPAPYPDLGTVRFAKLLVNGRPPSMRHLLSLWMTAGHLNFGASPVIQDAFEVEPRSVSEAGERYLHLANPLDRDTAAFLGEVRRWNKSTSLFAIAQAKEVEAGALTHFIRGLTSTRWPSRVAPLLHELVSANARLLADVRTPPGAVLNSLTGWRRRLAGTVDRLTGKLVRGALGVPQVAPIASECLTTEHGAANCAP
jgi:hypothetical protein